MSLNSTPRRTLTSRFCPQVSNSIKKFQFHIFMLLRKSQSSSRVKSQPRIHSNRILLDPSRPKLTPRNRTQAHGCTPLGANSNGCSGRATEVISSSMIKCRSKSSLSSTSRTSSRRLTELWLALLRGKQGVSIDSQCLNSPTIQFWFK